MFGKMVLWPDGGGQAVGIGRSKVAVVVTLEGLWKVWWDMVLMGPVGDEKDLEVHSMLFWKPVKVWKDECDAFIDMMC